MGQMGPVVHLVLNEPQLESCVTTMIRHDRGSFVELDNILFALYHYKCDVPDALKEDCASIWSILNDVPTTQEFARRVLIALCGSLTSHQKCLLTSSIATLAVNKKHQSRDDGDAATCPAPCSMPWCICTICIDNTQVNTSSAEYQKSAQAILDKFELASQTSKKRKHL